MDTDLFWTCRRTNEFYKSRKILISRVTTKFWRKTSTT